MEDIEEEFQIVWQRYILKSLLSFLKFLNAQNPETSFYGQWKTKHNKYIIHTFYAGHNIILQSWRPLGCVPVLGFKVEFFPEGAGDGALPVLNVLGVGAGAGHVARLVADPARDLRDVGARHGHRDQLEHGHGHAHHHVDHQHHQHLVPDLDLQDLEAAVPPYLEIGPHLIPPLLVDAALVLLVVAAGVRNVVLQDVPPVGEPGVKVLCSAAPEVSLHRVPVVPDSRVRVVQLHVLGGGAHWQGLGRHDVSELQGGEQREDLAREGEGQEHSHQGDQAPVFSAGDEEAINAHHEGVQPQGQHAPGGGEKVPRPESKLR